MFGFLKKMTKQETSREHGRSMVEMLGVLAIIGVLSIGGIAGYTMAMNRHKANQILDLASKLSVSAQTLYASDPDNFYNMRGQLYEELGMDNYVSHGGAYETTFIVDENGNVNVGVAGSSNQGIRRALESITGVSASPVMKIITVK